MKKKKVSIKDIIAEHFWLKVISLIVAIGLWLYLSAELSKDIRV